MKNSTIREVHRMSLYPTQDLYDRVSDYADKFGIPVSSAFCLLATYQLDALEAQKSLSELNEFKKMLSDFLPDNQTAATV